MEALRKQASKLKEQVAKQQQAVIKQFGGTGYESSDVMVIDEAELQRHQQLEKLYRSTRAGRDFQKDIIRAAEGFAAIGYKHIEIGTKLSEDCYKYGGENKASDEILAKSASLYGGALINIEKEHEDFNKLLTSQIMEPLRAMAIGAPLEDARNLAQRYSRMRHDAESLAAEISRRQFRVREAPILENTTKLQTSEARMHELKANMAVLGKEAAAALAAVESLQQRLTFQRLLAMVEAEKSFHLRVAAVLDDAEAEMVSEKQQKESAPPLSHKRSEKALYFLAEAMYNFNAASEKELSLVVGDYVVVRQVTASGWSEGECRGKAGWFPSDYVEKRQNIPPNKVFTRAY
ncbi:SH3 domain-containing protein 3 [Elaeis guineensis]|uniref:SH3 domain-containing protein 3 isoform X1 n=1 Tax=Elaeis guineensis var. tenera TaxID=51953 RepID=A0A6I9RNQ7_ELAGV|nr:SH3 domain-containing protein 3 isoform X1 [Elaeis guineensis]